MKSRRKSMINKETTMLLFRYSNYRKYSFIDEHMKIIHNLKYVWMMKMGKKTSIEKIKSIIKSGGYIVFKAPVADGSHFYIGKFVDFREELPNDEKHMPKYYSEIVEDINFWDAPTQFFKLVDIVPLNEEYAAALRLEKNKKKVLDVINETRTAVMFIENEKEMDIALRNGEK